MQSSKRSGMPPVFPTTFSLGSFNRRHLVGAPLSVTSGLGLGCSSRFAGGQRTAGFISAISGHGLASRARRPWPFTQSGLNTSTPRPGLEIERLASSTSSASQPPKCLRSECVVMKEQFQFKRLSPRLARPSKVARFAVTPPPNHSFKRTRLRRSA